jgi:rhombotail lipoprotein
MNASHLNTNLLAALCAFGLLATACGAAPSVRAREASAPAQAAPAPVLDRSLFSRDGNGSVSETDLQRILDSRIDLTFPARVGVVLLAEPFRAEAGAPLSEQARVAPELTRMLKGSNHFSHVTDVSTDLPNPQGMEGLRTIAARYRLRYLLLCSDRSESSSHLNNWAWLYPTVLGFFAAPGVTVSSQGVLQASLLDVRTGTVLFTASEPYQASSTTWVIGSGRHYDKTQGDAMREASARLARAVLAQTDSLVQWAVLERRAPHESVASMP